jgi:hypothetical protein
LLILTPCSIRLISVTAKKGLDGLISAFEQSNKNTGSTVAPNVTYNNATTKENAQKIAQALAEWKKQADYLAIWKPNGVVFDSTGKAVPSGLYRTYDITKNSRDKGAIVYFRYAMSDLEGGSGLNLVEWNPTTPKLEYIGEKKKENKVVGLMQYTTFKDGVPERKWYYVTQGNIDDVGKFEKEYGKKFGNSRSQGGFRGWLQTAGQVLILGRQVLSLGRQTKSEVKGFENLF